MFNIFFNMSYQQLGGYSLSEIFIFLFFYFLDFTAKIMKWFPVDFEGPIQSLLF